MRDLSYRPDWVADAIFYQVFPDRFYRSGRVPSTVPFEDWHAPPTFHGYKGGDLFGVLEKLDWIQSLGANALYLNPIFQSAANHRYHTHDFLRIDPILGGDAAFQALLEGAHQRGMRIMLDGVFNHVSRGFFPFHDLLENGQNSPWRNWFTVKSWPLNAYDESSPPNYAAWWGLHALPKLNTADPQVRAMIMEVGEHWVTRGIDAWRLDVPNEIKTPGFWEEFRRRIRAKNNEIYLLAEIWDHASQWIADGTRFDGTMNYQFAGRVISYAGQDRVDPEAVKDVPYPVAPTVNADGLRRELEGQLSRWPSDAVMSNLSLLGSHDTPRMDTVLGGDDAAVTIALFLQFTFPGAPCIYYGDEIGMRGGPDPDCRRGFPWDRPERFNERRLGVTKDLAALRRAHPALRRGTTSFPKVEHGNADPLLFMMLRQHAEGDVLCVTNAGTQETAVTLPTLPGRREGPWRRVFGHGTVDRTHGTAAVSMPARSCGAFLNEP